MTSKELFKELKKRQPELIKLADQILEKKPGAIAEFARVAARIDQIGTELAEAARLGR